MSQRRIIIIIIIIIIGGGGGGVVRHIACCSPEGLERPMLSRSWVQNISEASWPNGAAETLHWGLVDRQARTVSQRARQGGGVSRKEGAIGIIQPFDDIWVDAINVHFRTTVQPTSLVGLQAAGRPAERQRGCGNCQLGDLIRGT